MPRPCWRTCIARPWNGWRQRRGFRPERFRRSFRTRSINCYPPTCSRSNAEGIVSLWVCAAERAREARNTAPAQRGTLSRQHPMLTIRYSREPPEVELAATPVEFARVAASITELAGSDATEIFVEAVASDPQPYERSLSGLHVS